MKRALALLASTALLACGSASAAITAANIGQNQNTTATTVITTTADSPAGSINVVAISTYYLNVSSVTDSAGNAYALCTAAYPAGTGNMNRVMLYADSNASGSTADLPNGGTITITSSAANKVNAAAASLSGVRNASPCDTNGQGSATGTNAGAVTAGPTTGTLTAQPQIVLGIFDINGAVSSDAYTQPSGWTALTHSGSSTTGAYLNWGYELVSATTPVSYNPTLSTSSRTWYAITGSLFDASIPVPVSLIGTRMSLTGVGH